MKLFLHNFRATFPSHMFSSWLFNFLVSDDPGVDFNFVKWALTGVVGVEVIESDVDLIHVVHWAEACWVQWNFYSTFAIDIEFGLFWKYLIILLFHTFMIICWFHFSTSRNLNPITIEKSCWTVPLLNYFFT